MTEPNNAADVRRAVDAWRAVVGAEYVRTGESDREFWGRRSFAPDAAVSAIVSPGSVAEVARCLKIAGCFGTPVHPVGRGANWGLGNRAPTVDGAVALDLSRLDRIVDFDPELGMVRIEAGVTFQALADFVNSRTRDFFLPVIGGPPFAGALSNALERGDGSMGERWSSLCDFEIVLPTGEILRTGCLDPAARAAAGLTPNVAGPMVEGLFSQSNFGIVTSAAVRLEPTPGDLADLSIDVGGPEELAAFLPVWRDCMREQSLAERSLTLWNGVKWLALDGVRADVPADELASAQIGEWRAYALIRAESPEILALRAERLADRFRPVVRAVEIDATRRNGVWSEGEENGLGVPDGRNMRTLYWYCERQPAPNDIDLDRDRCGLIWLCLAFPFEFAPLYDYLSWARDRLNAVGVDVNVGIESNGFRRLLSYFTIGFDGRVPGRAEAATAAYRDLAEEAARRGFPPYRLPNGAPMPDAWARRPLNGYLARLRAVGDPAGVLSPGRCGIG